MKIVNLLGMMVVCGSLLATTGCGGGGTGTGNPMVTVRSAPLAGPNAASSGKGVFWLAEMVFGIQSAFASVSNFASFTACNDTMIFIDDQGRQLNINGTENPSVGRGLLTFSNSSTAPMEIGALSIPLGTVLSEVDITFAVVPSVCQGANYAVQFDDGLGGDGPISVTQNTSFKFRFPAGGTAISSSGQVLTLKFGTIVNSMVSLGSALDNSTIQTINVGGAE